MSQRVERLSGEIRQILSEALARQEIKDPRVRDAGVITVTHVRLTGDLRQATVLFMVHGLNAAALEKVEAGLNHAAGFFRHRLGRELSVRAIPTVTFEIDKVFDQEAKIDRLLHEISAVDKPQVKQVGEDEAAGEPGAPPDPDHQ